MAQLPDVTLLPDVNFHPDVSMLPDVNLHPDVTLSTSPLAFLLAKLSPLKLHQGCVGPTWDPPYIRNTSHSQSVCGAFDRLLVFVDQKYHT